VIPPVTPVEPVVAPAPPKDPNYIEAYLPEGATSRSLNLLRVDLLNV